MSFRLIFFCPLCCQSFFYLRLLITTLLSSNLSEFPFLPLIVMIIKTIQFIIFIIIIIIIIILIRQWKKLILFCKITITPQLAKMWNPSGISLFKLAFIKWNYSFHKLPVSHEYYWDREKKIKYILWKKYYLVIYKIGQWI